MKRTCISLTCLLLIAIFGVSCSTDVFAQQAPEPGRIVIIRKIEPLKVQTPQYQLLKGQFMARTRDWFQVNTTYKTAPDWIDELTFTYYVLVKGKEAGAKYNLFRGEVTYANIQKGDHKSDMYLHPSTMVRFGDVERVAVVISSQGRIVAMESLPALTTRWWEQLTPVDGYVLNRMQTPFAMINFDDYEAVKAGAAR
ncbi:MAG: Amuc_1102 family pilus-like protein [Verrucomicrobiota bacterium]